MVCKAMEMDNASLLDPDNVGIGRFFRTAIGKS